jgi:hypothetical protein
MNDYEKIYNLCVANGYTNLMSKNMADEFFQFYDGRHEEERDILPMDYEEIETFKEEYGLE